MLHPARTGLPSVPVLPLLSRRMPYSPPRPVPPSFPAPGERPCRLLAQIRASDRRRSRWQHFHHKVDGEIEHPLAACSLLTRKRARLRGLPFEQVTNDWIIDSVVGNQTGERIGKRQYLQIIIDRCLRKQG